MLLIPNEDHVWQIDRKAASNLQDVEEIQRSLKSAGIPIPPNSRLDMYRQAIEAYAAPDQHGRAPMPQFLHRTLSEIRELRLIVQEMSRPPEVQGWQEKLRTILGGRVFPHEEGQNTQGRDTQFELYMAAAFRAAGYVIELAEPDVLFSDGTTTLALAAKRLKSRSMIRANVRKAAKQIVSSGRDGIIALDISPLQEMGKPIFINHMEGAQALAYALADGFAYDYMPRIVNEKWVEAESVFAICFCVTTRCFLLPDYNAITGLRWVFANLCHYTDERFGTMNQTSARLASVQF